MDENLVKELMAHLKDRVQSDPVFAKEFGQLTLQLAQLPERINRFAKEAAEVGWFITSESYLVQMKSALNQDPSELDRYMIQEIRNNYQRIKSTLLARHEDRREILECAFKLHEEKNWIASIPLFLAQTEGVFSSNFGTLLYSEHDKRKEKLEALPKEDADKLLPFLFSPFTTQIQVSARIDSASVNKKKRGPNRNGIMHGSRKHLDYGTEVNSYKCISLLSFVSMLFTEI